MPASRRPCRPRGLTEPAGPLSGRLRAALIMRAQRGAPVTYRDLAAQMCLQPPQTIRQLTDALEGLMVEDTARDAPYLAALCVSRAVHGLPRRGFFEQAARLGRFVGDPDPDGPAARRFHADELARLRALYRGG